MNRKITYEDVKEYCKPRCLTIIDNELLYELTHPKIKALEQEPSGDLISRQAVLETLDDMDNALDEDRTVENYKELLKECYEVLPPVNPQEPKIGHWVKSNVPNEEYVCSECGGACWYYDYQADVVKSRYCPNCGCRMVEQKESEVQE
jgi:hypothetical protein